ncbi:MAG TPA: hypothetical protein VK458_26255 [Myxococcaceae bacterium]|nr:hypothetical protein [Myxococcaceae bacterium]
MFKTSDVYSLTDFQRSAREHIQRLRDTRRPEVLTVNGKAEVVVQDADAYQDLLAPRYFEWVVRAESATGRTCWPLSYTRVASAPDGIR